MILIVGARRNTSVLKSSQTWLNERKDILRKIKDQVRLYLGEESQDITSYAQFYKNDVSRPWQASSFTDVETCLQQVDVVFGGDFHSFSQAQRAHLRFIRRIASERPMVLALECFFAKDQSIIDDYLNGKISEKKLLKKINWSDEWGFPWPHYRPLVEFAMQNKIKILALNASVPERTGESLEYRDQFAAQKIADNFNILPGYIHYVVYGDLHIAQNHLPSAFKKQMGSKVCDMASIYLNCEGIYFALAEIGQENTIDVVRFNDREFCVLSSPPWVKWQSYLMYLEENFDVDLELDDDDESDMDFWDFQIDYTDHVSNLVRMISSGIGLDIKTDAIQVYSLKDPQVLKIVRKKISKQDFELAYFLVKNDKSFYLPKAGFFYLSKATVNHAASLAGHYIHAQISMQDQLYWSFPGDFTKAIWIETMAFMLSKFVNPKRKSQSMSDLKKELHAFDSKDKGREPLLLALDQKMLEILVVYSEEPVQKRFSPVDRGSYTLAAKFLGEMLGERYFSLLQNKKITEDQVIELLEQDLNHKNFDGFYYNQLKYLDRLET